jgi:hypothetical protein
VKTRTTFRVLPFSFGILGTAMFAEPTVPEIEKVVGLLHEATVTDRQAFQMSKRQFDY